MYGGRWYGSYQPAWLMDSYTTMRAVGMPFGLGWSRWLEHLPGVWQPWCLTTWEFQVWPWCVLVGIVFPDKSCHTPFSPCDEEVREEYNFKHHINKKDWLRYNLIQLAYPTCITYWLNINEVWRHFFTETADNDSIKKSPWVKLVTFAKTFIKYYNIWQISQYLYGLWSCASTERKLCSVLI